MTNYYLNSDNIDGKEQSYINTVAKILEDAGHNVEKLAVGPNPNQAYSASSAATGKTSIIISGGRCVGTAIDYCEGISRGYYNCKRFIYAFASWTATKYITKHDLYNYKFQSKAWDDNFTSPANLHKYKADTGNLTWAEWAKQDMVKRYIGWAAGDSPEELGKNILKEIGGGESDDSGGTASTIKDALKKLLAYNDGDIECRVEGNKVYVNKIPEPTSTGLLISEGLNIVDDTVTIKDYYPNTPNILFVDDKEYYRDEALISRFGEKPTYLSTVVEETEEETDEETGETTTKTSAKPIEDVDAYALTEWNKLKRDDGHTIDLKVAPDPLIHVGQWARVYIPSYGEDGYMYITKASNSLSPDGETVTSLTLADYPPGFGTVEPETEEEEEEETEEEEEEVEE